MTPDTLAKVVATSKALAQQSAKPAPGGKDGLKAALDNKLEGTQLSPAKTAALQVSGTQVCICLDSGGNLSEPANGGILHGLKTLPPTLHI